VSTRAERVVVTLYTREGCHLCEEAKAAMVTLIEQANAELRVIDIDDDPDLLAMYNDSVPAIFIGANFFARYRVDAQRFAKALEAAGGKT
jgi:glutaredoxin